MLLLALLLGVDAERCLAFFAALFFFLGLDALEASESSESADTWDPDELYDLSVRDLSFDPSRVFFLMEDPFFAVA